MAQLTDEQIARMAKARVSFRMNLAAYVLVNLFLIAIWWINSGGRPPTFRDDSDAYFWPVWPLLGWGLGLAFHWYGSFGPGSGMQQREEQRIRREMGKT
jgi:hypothetical protein